jgi:hypothetical protein
MSFIGTVVSLTNDNVASPEITSVQDNKDSPEIVFHHGVEVGDNEGDLALDVHIVLPDLYPKLKTRKNSMKKLYVNFECSM